MGDMTDAVREALGDVAYGNLLAPTLDDPQEDSSTVAALITDPVHCTARHRHHDFQSVVASAMCGLVGQVPDNTFIETFSHQNRPNNIPRDAPRDPEWTCREETTDEHRQGAMFLAMAGWMCLVKQVEDTKNNYVYVEKRWKAAMTGLGITDKVCHVSKREILLAVSEAVSRSRVVRSRFVRTFIAMDTAGGLPVYPVRAAIINKVKMVWEFQGMCSYRLMNDIIFTDSPVLAMAREAVIFKRHYTALQEKMGSHIPYTGVLGMVPAGLTISRYPNLYLVAISHAKSTGNLLNFQQSTIRPREGAGTGRQGDDKHNCCQRRGTTGTRSTRASNS